MASEPKGTYNRATTFNDEKYGYWKGCMRVHINYIYRNVCKTVQNGPFEITMINADGVVVPISEAQWNAKDEKKSSYDWKARNILISVLGVHEYYCVTHYTTV